MIRIDLKYRTSGMSLDYQSPNLLAFEERFKIQSVLRSFLLMAIKINSTHRKRNKKQRKRMHLKRGRKRWNGPKVHTCKDYTLKQDVGVVRLKLTLKEKERSSVIINVVEKIEYWPGSSQVV